MNTIPIDPPLRSDFDSTPNEQRSPDEIAEWWDRPYAVRRGDGRFDVRCLDGGAWDRSTNYGIAETEQEAGELAERKLKEWQALRSRPIIQQDGAEIAVVVPSQRPGEPMRELGRFTKGEEVRAFMEKLKQERA